MIRRNEVSTLNMMVAHTQLLVAHTYSLSQTVIPNS